MCFQVFLFSFSLSVLIFSSDRTNRKEKWQPLLAVSPFFFIGQRYKPTHTHTHTHTHIYVQKRHISSTRRKERSDPCVCMPKSQTHTNAHWVAVSRSGRMDTNDDGVASGTTSRKKNKEERQQQIEKQTKIPSTGCLTPWTYTECILSFIHSGIPSVYVTGGNTFNILHILFCGPQICLSTTIPTDAYR